MIFIIAGIIIGVILEDYSKIFGGFCGFIVGLVVYGIFGSIILTIHMSKFTLIRLNAVGAIGLL